MEIGEATRHGRDTGIRDYRLTLRPPYAVAEGSKQRIARLSEGVGGVKEGTDDIDLDRWI